MGRKANNSDRHDLYDAIERHPHNKKGFFARLLGWHPQKIERELVYLNDDDFLLMEDDDNNIAPLGD